MVERTFLWHDYETFGANARRDRPAQLQPSAPMPR